MFRNHRATHSNTHPARLPNTRRRRPERAFTLVELLVVIGIIAVLISILLPALSAARNSAQSIKCLANLRSLGQSMVIFSDRHGGRLPGNGLRKTPSQAGVPWQAVMSVEFFRLRDYVPQLGPLENGNAKLFCPTNSNATNTSRFWAMNSDFNGGLIDATYPAGRYGLLLTPPEQFDADYAEISRIPNFSFGPGGHYRLGAKLATIKNSSEKFLVWDSDRNDVGGPTVTTDTTEPTFFIGDGVTATPSPYPPHSAAMGVFSFRHSRNKRMNVLFVDGHAESMHFSTSYGKPKNFRVGK